ncbi:MAG: pyruvate dehydrogenase (acetyl-transferring), homodimeric type, partial [Sedimenticola sp.]|nr:pyruvate dehydrogenase (acetyl-transferring), homodimeric type [Sedimenticola sp.]
EGAEEGILKGLYHLRSSELDKKGKKKSPRVQLLGCGTILNEVIEAAELLKNDFKVEADIWSATSFNELCRDGQDVERWNRLHPEQPARVSHVEACLKERQGPVIAATDYMKSFAEQIRPFVPGKYTVLGTDGFGRSDSREGLRSHFEVDRYHVAVAALKALADEGIVPVKQVTQAIQQYGIDTDKPNPVTV